MGGGEGLQYNMQNLSAGLHYLLQILYFCFDFLKFITLEEYSVTEDRYWLATSRCIRSSLVYGK